MRQMKISKKIFFSFLLLLGTLPSYAQFGGISLKVSFNVNGFQLGEVYPEAVQKTRLQGARIKEWESEFGLGRIYMFGRDEEANFTFFRFSANELREFYVMNKIFALSIGKVSIKVGDSFDKLKGVSKLKMEQAIDYTASPKPKPMKGAWILKHPDLLEDVFEIIVYEENGIVTAFTGIMLL